MSNSKSKKWLRLKSKAQLVAAILSSNCLVILVTIFQGISLENVAKAYWFQLFVNFVLTVLQILAAKNAGSSVRGSAQPFTTTKYVSVAMFVVFNGTFMLGHFWVLYMWLNPDDPIIGNLIYVTKCSMVFVAYSLYIFWQERVNGYHQKLVDDGEVFRFWIRIQAVLIPCLLFLSTKRNMGVDYTEGQAVLVVAVIAIVDSATQIIREERRAASRNGSAAVTP